MRIVGRVLVVAILVAIQAAVIMQLRSATTYAQETQAFSWTTERVGAGIKPALAIDAADTVHIAYLTEQMTGGVFYSTREDGTWNATTVAHGYFYGPLDLAVTASGQPFIAYHDHQDQQFNPAKGDAVVASRDGENWNLLAIAHSGHDGWDNSIAVDADGFWHTAAVDPRQFGSQDGVEYATNAYGDVIVEAVGSGPAAYEFATSIALRDDGVVGITYFNDTDADLYYAERSAGRDGSWVVERVDGDGDAGRYAALVFDSAGNPHISYFRFDGATNGTVRFASRSDGTWLFEDIGTLESVHTGMIGARKITALAFDADDNVFAAYTDQSRLVFARRTDSGWEQHIVLESAPDTGLLSQLVELALDSKGQPHLVTYVADDAGLTNAEVLYLTGTAQD